MKKLKNTRTLTLMGVLVAIQLVLTFTPLGFIPLGFMKATTLHIPVIIGSIFLGPVEGGLLGLVFGILSVVTNTFTPGPISFVFSPFYTVGDFNGNAWSLVIAIVPRVLVGIFPYYVSQWLAKVDRTKVAAYAAAGLAGALTNTIFVMGGIYIFFAEPYAAVKGIEVGAVFGAIMAVVVANGIPEAIVAAIIVGAVGKALSKVFVKHEAFAK